MASSGKKKRPSSPSTTGKGQNSRTGGTAIPRAPKPGAAGSGSAKPAGPSADGSSTKSSSSGGARRKSKIPESARPQPRARGGARSSADADPANGNGQAKPSGSAGSSRNGATANANGNGKSQATSAGGATAASSRRRNDNGRGRSAATDAELEALDFDVELDDLETDGDGVEVVDDVEVLDDDGAPVARSQTLVERLTSSFTSLTRPAGQATDDDPAPARTRAPAKTKAEPTYDEDGWKIPTWGLGDVAIGFVLMLLAFTVSFLPLQALGYLPGVGGTGWPAGEATGHVAIGQAPSVTLGFGDAPTPLRILLSYLPLWLALMVPTAYAVWRKGNGFVKDLGLRMEWIDIPLGLGIGVACQLVVVPLIYVVVNRLVPNQNVGAVAQQVTDQAVDPLSTILIFLVVGVGAPIVEEIFYRGLSLRAAERRFGPSWALLGTSAVFALMHGAPIVLPGLLVFALVLGYLAQRFGRLGPSIFAHMGFNLVTALVLIFQINWAWIS